MTILINRANGMKTSSDKAFFLLPGGSWSKAVRAGLSFCSEAGLAPVSAAHRVSFVCRPRLKWKNLFGGRAGGGPLLLLVISMLLILLPLADPQPAFAAGLELEIVGPGLRGEGIVVSPDQMKGTVPLLLPDGTEAKQYDEWYSSINTWPSKIWYRGRGLKLKDLLAAAGGLREDATLINFISSDGFKATFTVQELLREPAFRFPNFIDSGLEGHLSGDSANAVSVEPMIAHHSFSAHTKVEIRLGERFDSNDGNHLLFGQRAVSHQNNPRFAKYVTKIEVLTDEIPVWDPPTAAPVPGSVAAGTTVELEGPFGDEDKVYYTLDGSDPTIDSSMYNYVARRWWGSRRETLAEINRPIAITDDTVIKAVTIGPGKLDSSVVTFHYQLLGQELKPDSAGVIVLTVGRQEATVDNKLVILDAAPYLKPEAGRTLVPLRFISEAFQADVGWDPQSRRIKVGLGPKEIILTLGSDQVRVNGAVQTIDCPPELHPSGRTFVPLRFISEVLGTQDLVYDSGRGKISILN